MNFFTLRQTKTCVECFNSVVIGNRFKLVETQLQLVLLTVRNIHRRGFVWPHKTTEDRAGHRVVSARQDR